jgi:hypothetical protein
VCEEGLSESRLGEIKRLKEEERGRLSAFEASGVSYHEGASPWGLTEARVALPCATQHELDIDNASALMERGLRFVAEGANMPCTHAARDAFVREGVRFGPGKASNAGGVACSGFEMSQNATRTSWTRDKTIERVEERLHELEESLPAGVEIVTTYNRAGLIERAVDSLKEKLIEEFIVVAVICAIFLFHLRSSLVIVLSLPLGVLAAFVVMNAQGINANIMSLGGIAIAVGAMVDGSFIRWPLPRPMRWPPPRASRSRWCRC